MNLVSSDGAAVELRPTRYQFGSSGSFGDWDANWLVIAGHVTLADGRSWSFADPCLTTWEARELGSWLRSVGSGDVPTTAADAEDGQGRLTFTEPNLAFSLAGRSEESATVRVHLSLESLPPWDRGVDRPGHLEHVVEVQLTTTALADAELAWARDLAPFPVR